MNTFPNEILHHILVYALTNHHYLNVALVCKLWLSVYQDHRLKLQPYDERTLCVGTVYAKYYPYPHHMDHEIRTRFHCTLYTLTHYITNYIKFKEAQGSMHAMQNNLFHLPANLRHFWIKHTNPQSTDCIRDVVYGDIASLQPLASPPSIPSWSYHGGALLNYRGPVVDLPIISYTNGGYAGGIPSSPEITKQMTANTKQNNEFELVHSILCSMVTGAFFVDGFPNFWMRLYIVCIYGNLVNHGARAFTYLGESCYNFIRKSISKSCLAITRDGVMIITNKFQPLNMWQLMCEKEQAIDGRCTPYFDIFCPTQPPPKEQIKKIYTAVTSYIQKSNNSRRTRFLDNILTQIYLGGEKHVAKYMTSTGSIDDVNIDIPLVIVDIYYSGLVFLTPTEYSVIRPEGEIIANASVSQDDVQVDAASFVPPAPIQGGQRVQGTNCRKMSKRVHNFCVNINARIASNQTSFTNEETACIVIIRKVYPEAFELPFHASIKYGIATHDMIATEGSSLDHLDLLLQLIANERTVCAGRLPFNSYVDIRDLLQRISNSVDKDGARNLIRRILFIKDNKLFTRTQRMATLCTGRFTTVRNIINHHQLTLTANEFDYIPIEALRTTSAKQQVLALCVCSKDIAVNMPWSKFLELMSEKASLPHYNILHRKFITRWKINELLSSKFTFEDAFKLMDDMMLNYDGTAKDVIHHHRGVLPSFVVMAVYIMACKLTGRDFIPKLREYNSHTCSQCIEDVNNRYKELGWDELCVDNPAKRKAEDKLERKKSSKREKQRQVD